MFFSDFLKIHPLFYNVLGTWLVITCLIVYTNLDDFFRERRLSLFSIVTSMLFGGGATAATLLLALKFPVFIGVGRFQIILLFVIAGLIPLLVALVQIARYKNGSMARKWAEEKDQDWLEDANRLIFWPWIWETPTKHKSKIKPKGSQAVESDESTL